MTIWSFRSTMMAVELCWNFDWKPDFPVDWWTPESLLWLMSIGQSWFPESSCDLWWNRSHTDRWWLWIENISNCWTLAITWHVNHIYFDLLSVRIAPQCLTAIYSVRKSENKIQTKTGKIWKLPLSTACCRIFASIIYSFWSHFAKESIVECNAHLSAFRMDRRRWSFIVATVHISNYFVFTKSRRRMQNRYGRTKQ